ncbi:MAG TPA: energy-coupling factor transporter ATPase [Bacillota bacterium]|nr:energy-coupling factor transporter ATPase [Clostridiales bacterium]HPU17157.1 energy-coupling factor transporter ATPase [Bacillota bacterium]
MSGIRLDGVSYVYSAGMPYEKKALDNISVEFEDGKMTGIIGHTGSGKSTLVQLLNGLLKPTSGKIYLGGTDIWAEPKKIRSVRFRVGLVMQYPEYQLFDETVRSDIAFGPRNMGLSDAEIKERVVEAARFAGLDESLLDKSPFELSGGQKRRAAIAGVMAMRPEVLVLDEPAAGLDPAGRESVLEGIRRYGRENKATVILVSHSMEDMAEYCDNIVVLSRGQLYLSGKTSDVFRHWEMLTKVGLGVPMITRVAAELRRLGVPMDDDIYTVSGAVANIAAIMAGKEGGSNA